MKNIKNTVFALILLVSTTFLTACGSNGTQATAASNSSGGASVSSVLKTNYENALPVITQLAVGTFLLDESDAALTAEQAGALLPLWKGYRSLSTSGNVSTKELEGLIAQIEKAYSAEQLQAIAGMELTMEDMAQLAQEKNIVLGGPGPGNNANLTEEQQATREALRALRQSSGGSGNIPGGGGPPPGGFFGGGGMPPGGGDPGSGFVPPNQATPGAVETAMAGRMGARGAGVSPGLVQALIEYLQTIIQP